MPLVVQVLESLVKLVGSSQVKSAGHGNVTNARTKHVGLCN